MIQRDESEQHFTRRLEAFSDIVIGFSLAQLGATLTSKSLTHPLELLVFLLPFAVVCSLWFFHHRLFSQVFVPKTWPVVLNFVWLASVVLIVFVAIQYTQNGTPAVTRFYFGCYAFVYGLLAVQFVIAMGYARERNSPAARLRGLRGAWFMFVWTLPFVLAFIIAVLFPPGPVYMLISLGFAIAGVLSPGMRRRFDAAEAKLRAA